MPITSQLPVWTGTFAISDSSCDQLQCCCLVNNIILTQPISTTIHISFALNGTCGTMLLQSVSGTYPNGYNTLLTLYQYPYYLALGSDSNTIIFANLGSPRCSAMASRLLSTTFTQTSTSGTFITTSTNILSSSTSTASTNIVSSSTSTTSVSTNTITSTSMITTISSSTITTVVLTTSEINQLPPWPGTFVLRSLCNQLRCCCPINTVVTTKIASNTLRISTTLSGFATSCFVFGGSRTLDVDYPTQYIISLTFFSIAYRIVLSSDGTTITLTDLSNSACSETGIRSGVGR